MPGPATVSESGAPPLTAPLIVALPAAESVVAASSVTGPLKVGALVPPMVGAPLNCTGLLNVSPAAVGRKVPPDSHRLPPPRGAALPRLRVPPATVVSPLTVAAFPSARVPAPPSSASGPLTDPVSVVVLLTVRPAPIVVVMAPPSVKLWPPRVTGPLTVSALARVSPEAAPRRLPPLSVTLPPSALALATARLPPWSVRPPV